MSNYCKSASSSSATFSSSSSSSSSSASSSPSREDLSKDGLLAQHSRRSRSPTHFFYTREALLQLRPAPGTPFEDGQHPYVGNGNLHPSVPAGLISSHKF